MTQYELSAIIGWYRSGASVMDIYFITTFGTQEIEKAIKDYINGNRQPGDFKPATTSENAQGEE